MKFSSKKNVHILLSHFNCISYVNGELKILIYCKEFLVLYVLYLYFQNQMQGLISQTYSGELKLMQYFGNVRSRCFCWGFQSVKPHWTL